MKLTTAVRSKNTFYQSFLLPALSTLLNLGGQWLLVPKPWLFWNLAHESKTQHSLTHTEPIFQLHCPWPHHFLTDNIFELLPNLSPHRHLIQAHSAVERFSKKTKSDDYVLNYPWKKLNEILDEILNEETDEYFPDWCPHSYTCYLKLHAIKKNSINSFCKSWSIP